MNHYYPEKSTQQPPPAAHKRTAILRHVAALQGILPRISAADHYQRDARHCKRLAEGHAPS